MPFFGQYRYYEGLVHYLAMLHLSGNFKIWKPTAKSKTVELTTAEDDEYNGVHYNKDTTIHSFEDCQLYNVKITVKSTTEESSSSTSNEESSSSQESSSSSSSVEEEPTSIGNHLAVNDGVRVWSNINSIVVENAAPNTKYVIADLNGRVLKVSQIHSANQAIRLNNRGPMLVIVGNRTFKIVK